MSERHRTRRGENRERLMEAALALVGEGRHFAGMGIREVTRRAGVVPTAFYRHFRSMDELGLSLVDELGLLLRQMMRDARRQAPMADRLIDDSVDVFIANVLANRAFFIFMSQCLAGESRAVREAIRSEMRFFAHELASDLRQFKLLPHLDDAALEMVCELVIRTVAFSLTDLLGLDPEDEAQIQRVRDRTVSHLRLIFVGAEHWRQTV
ncbi:TetR family transcriptional regulator [Mangrovitalea sediminis]|uniref:TetR family transcriptional regulator n=1 Tax=Mangrovitalea sediminis TaxID=1982043 RepID=UPI000BE62816|nr:TetR family transcriptional regulator [Mangrovitalea sediminis]